MTATEQPNTAVEQPVAGPPADEVQSAQLLPDDGVSLDEIDSLESAPSKPEAPAVEKPAEQKPEAVAATAPPTTEDARRQQLIAEHAAKLKVDPNDPAFAGVLKQLADKDLYIEKLKAGQAATAQPAAADYLTEFEKQLLKGQEPPPAAEPAKTEPPAQPGQTAAPAGPVPLGDIGDTWKGPDDAYTALNQAWAAKGGPDLKRINDIEVAMFTRRALEVVPQIIQRLPQQVAQKIVQQALGQEFVETLPEIQETFRSRQSAQDAQVVLSELKKDPRYTDLDKLYEKEGDGEIEVFGQKFPATVMNRILAENQEILQIGPPPNAKNPRAAAQAAQAARMRMVHRIWKAEQQAKSAIDPKQAQTLVETGRKMEQQAQTDHTRQSLNAGSGATTAAGQAPARQSYVKELISARREGIGLSLDDL